MIVFPTLAATDAGRLMGRLCSVQAGIGFFTLGKLFALLLIPFAIGLFVFSLLPGVITRYRLTNRRVIVESGLRRRRRAMGRFRPLRRHRRRGAARSGVVSGRRTDLSPRSDRDLSPARACRDRKRFATPAWRPSEHFSAPADYKTRLQLPDLREILQNHPQRGGRRVRAQRRQIQRLVGRLRVIQRQMDERRLGLQLHSLGQVAREVKRGVAQVRSGVIRNLRRNARVSQLHRPIAQRQRTAIGDRPAVTNGRN